MPRCFRAAGNVVRIVAGGALQGAIALQKALRAADAVDGIYQLELVLATRPRSVVEEKPIRAQRLAGPVLERAPLVPLNRVRQGKARGLEMALDAHLLPEFRAQP